LVHFTKIKNVITSVIKTHVVFVDFF